MKEGAHERLDASQRTVAGFRPLIDRSTSAKPFRDAIVGLELNVVLEGFAQEFVASTFDVSHTRLQSELDQALEVHRDAAEDALRIKNIDIWARRERIWERVVEDRRTLDLIASLEKGTLRAFLNATHWCWAKEGTRVTGRFTMPRLTRLLDIDDAVALESIKPVTVPLTCPSCAGIGRLTTRSAALKSITNAAVFECPECRHCEEIGRPATASAAIVTRGSAPRLYCECKKCQGYRKEALAELPGKLEWAIEFSARVIGDLAIKICAEFGKSGVKDVLVANYHSAYGDGLIEKVKRALDSGGDCVKVALEWDRQKRAVTKYYAKFEREVWVEPLLSRGMVKIALGPLAPRKHSARLDLNARQSLDSAIRARLALFNVTRNLDGMVQDAKSQDINRIAQWIATPQPVTSVRLPVDLLVYAPTQSAPTMATVELTDPEPSTADSVAPSTESRPGVPANRLPVVATPRPALSSGLKKWLGAIPNDVPAPVGPSTALQYLVVLSLCIEGSRNEPAVRALLTKRKSDGKPGLVVAPLSSTDSLVRSLVAVAAHPAQETPPAAGRGQMAERDTNTLSPQFINDAVEQAVRESDEAHRAVLRSFAFLPSKSGAVPIASLSAEVILELIRSGKVYWGMCCAGPLKVGEPTSAHIDWEINDKLMLAPKLRYASKDVRVYSSKPRVYLDENGLVVGLVDFGVADDVVAWIETAKALPYGEAQAACAALHERFPAIHLEDPPVLVIEDHGRIGGQWRMKVGQSFGYANDEVVVGKLSVSYPFDASSADKDGRVIKVVDGVHHIWNIDKTADKAITEELSRHGFEMAKFWGHGGDEAVVLRDAGNEGAPDRTKWLRFQHNGGVENLAKVGMEVVFAPNFPYVLRGRAKWSVAVTRDDRGSYSAEIEAGGLTPEELAFAIRYLLKKNDHFREAMDDLDSEWNDYNYFARLETGGYAVIDPKRARRIAGILLELETENLKGGKIRLGRFDGVRFLEAVSDERLDIIVPQEFLDLPRQLLNYSKELPKGLPAHMVAVLKHYQVTNLSFLYSRWLAGLGALLGDPTGAGKTIQILLHICGIIARGEALGPNLIVAKVSGVGQWLAQQKLWDLPLKMIDISGLSPTKRRSLLASWSVGDVFLTNHDKLSRDVLEIKALPWDVVAIDEIHHFRNHTGERWANAREINPRQYIGVSGSPIHNSTVDLWAITEIVFPGLWHSLAWFKRRFRAGTESMGEVRDAIDKSLQERARRTRGGEKTDHGTADEAKVLGSLLSLCLTRTPIEVVRAEMPKLQEIIQPIRLSAEELDIYETVRLRANEKIRSLLSSQGLAKSQIEILKELMQLRQVCCHPALVLKSYKKRKSAKLDAVCDLVEELKAEGRKVIVTSNFVRFLEMVKVELEEAGIETAMITGDVHGAARRQEQIDRFSQPEVAVMLLSMQAGGESIDLPQADVTIICDPWWNPQVEQQAKTRMLRLSQTKPTTAIFLVVEGSVEDAVRAVAARKENLANAVLAGASIASGKLTQEDIEALLRQLHRGQDID